MHPTLPSQTDIRPKRQRLWAFRMLTVLGTWITCEILSWGALYFAAGGWSVAETIRDGIARRDDESWYVPAEDILHPYTGWVRRPRAERDPITRQWGVNEFGLPGAATPIVQREPNRFLIAVTGGSLAEEFGHFGSETLRAALQSAAQFQGRNVEIICLALSGYKQPQQLMQFSYLMSLGAEFDLVVNIDGFNELVLPEIENVPNQVFPAFPRGWHARVTDAGDLKKLKVIGLIAACQSRDQAWSRSLARFPYKWSPTASLAWLLMHRRTEEEYRQLYQQIEILQRREQVLPLLGPRQQFESHEELEQHCVGIWKRCSLLLSQLCGRNGTRYLHFLQPNQYVPDSRPKVTGRSSMVASLEKTPGGHIVERGYRLLISAGAELRKAGVEFHDLTRIFQDETEETYRDECCHLNDRGNLRLAQRIAEAILAERLPSVKEH